MNLSIPKECLVNHTGIIGKAGSGKTNTAKGFAEYLLAKGERVCAIDPTGVWWGLRSKADGNQAAYPVVVFGGRHADVPLNQNQGVALAEIIATTNTPAILDTKLMSVGERTRFFTDFAETLLRKNVGPLHLFIDEAHCFAPQGRVADPQSGKMLHAANNLVSLGRSTGLRIVLISQRPAKLHKDSLTQVETLIAHRLIAPQDRNAVKDWILEWADPKEGAELLREFPSLKTGTGWVWSPEIGLLKKVEFPKITTYDSGKSPDGKQKEIVLAKIDMASIEKRLGAIADENKANNPAHLKMKIAELQKQLKLETPAIDQAELNRIRDEAVLKGKEIGISQGFAMAIEVLKSHKLPETKSIPQKPVPIAIEKQSPALMQKSATSSEIKLAVAERKFLTVLAQRGSALTRNKVAIFAGYSVTSGHIDNTLGGLRSKGFAAGTNDAIKITQAGLDALGSYDPLPHGEELQRYWLGQVDKAGAAFLKVLIDIYPNGLTRNELAEKAGYNVTSGHVDNTLGRLRSMDLVEGRNDFIKASDDLFQDAA